MWRSLSTNNYVEVSRQFNLALSWLEASGIRITNGRVRDYQRIINELAKCQIANDYTDFEERYRISDFVNAAFEISQLLGIYEGLNALPTAELKQRLSNAVGGHTLYSQDNALRSGRDFAFELFVASLFAKCGAGVDLRSGADVKISFIGHEAHVECKRPRSNKTVERNVKEALKQLRSGFTLSPDSYGLVAVSIDKLLNPGLGQLVVSSSSDASALASNIIKQFINQHSHTWKHPSVDHRVIGCMAVLSAPVFVKPENQTIAVHQVGFSVLAQTLSAQNWWLEQLVKKGFNES